MRGHNTPGLLLFLTASTTTLGHAQTSTSVIGRDDLFRPVPDAWVGIMSNAGLSVVSRDANGQTPYVPTTAYSTALIALGESETIDGTILGMIHGSGIPGDPNVPVDYTRTLHQPLAKRVQVQPVGPGLGSINGLPHNGRWELLVPGNAAYAFEAEVGILHTENDIMAHLYYEGVTLDMGSAKVAAVLKCKPVDLGTQGLLVRIACEGHEFGARPNARIVNLADTPGANVPATPATARVVDWIDEQAFVFLDHELGDGEHIILLSPNDDGSAGIQDPSALEIVDTNPIDELLLSLGMLPPAGSTNSSAAAVTDCTPPTPGPPANMQGCTPESPNDTWGHFFFGQCDWTLLVSGCFTATELASNISCGPEGGTTGRRAARTLGGSLSIGGTILGAEISSEGSYEVEVESSEGYTFQEGNGCGQCWGLFSHSRICFSLWQGWCHRYEPAPWATGHGVTIAGFCTVPCGYELTICVGQTISTSTTCDRTCQ